MEYDLATQPSQMVNDLIYSETDIEVLKDRQEVSTDQPNTATNPEDASDASDASVPLSNVSKNTQVLDWQPPRRVSEYNSGTSGPTILSGSPSAVSQDKQKPKRSMIKMPEVTKQSKPSATRNQSGPPRKRFSSSHELNEESLITRPSKFQRKRGLITLYIPAWVGNGNDKALFGKKMETHGVYFL